jgi:SAM-dependent methyltransferase
MGFLGGPLAYRFLRARYPGGRNDYMPEHDTFKERGLSKLKAYFGPSIYDECAGLTVVDFGCGWGDNAIELARNGARRVIGVDTDEERLEIARTSARAAGVADRVEFVSSWVGRADIVISTDAMEHFADPVGMLRTMRNCLDPTGKLLVEFGPTWFHPIGGHLFSPFPWAHLIFTEGAFGRWRADFKSDGKNRFSDHLNFMTISRWEQIVPLGGFRLEWQELVPIKAVRPLHNRLTREFFTALVRARLRPA